MSDLSRKGLTNHRMLSRHSESCHRVWTCGWTRAPQKRRLAPVLFSNLALVLMLSQHGTHLCLGGVAAPDLHLDAPPGWIPVDAAEVFCKGRGG